MQAIHFLRPFIWIFAFCFSSVVFSQTCRIDSVSAPDSICACVPTQLIAYPSADHNNILFNGNGYLTAPNSTSFNSIGNEMTITCWVKLNNTTTNQKILGKTTIAFNGGFLMGVQGGTIYFELWNSSGTLYSLLDGAVPGNVWTHLALTYKSGGVIRAYVNGVKTDSATVASLPVGSNTNDFIIGSAPWDITYYPVTGQIDEIKVYNVEHSSSLIQSKMNTMVPYNDPGLIAYWTMDEGSGTMVNDISGNGNNAGMSAFLTWNINSQCPVSPLFSFSWSPAICLGSSTVANPWMMCCDTGVHTMYIQAINQTTLCSDTDTIQMFLRPVPDAFAGNDSTVCEGSGPVTLSGSPAGGLFSGNGVSGNLYTPTMFGNIDTVIYSVTNNQGCVGKDTLYFNVAVCDGILENSSNHKITISPNPGNGVFRVSQDNSFDRLQIIDLSGRLIYKDEFLPTHARELLLPFIGSGMFFVKTFSDSEFRIQKLILHNN